VRRLAKWIIPVVLVIAAGWYYLPTLNVYAPRGYSIEVDTPGGPVEFKLVFWPNSRGTRWKPHVAQIYSSFRSHDIEHFDGFAIAETVRYEPDRGLIEVRFHDGVSHLRLSGDAEQGMLGEWVVQRGGESFTLPARAWKGSGPGWEASTSDESPHNFPDLGTLHDPSDGLTIEMVSYWNLSKPYAMAEVHSGLELHDFMHGQIEGNTLRLSYFDGRDAYLLIAKQDDHGVTDVELWNGVWEHRRLERVMP
jgi:hypothetical protein